MNSKFTALKEHLEKLYSETKELDAEVYNLKQRFFELGKTLFTAISKNEDVIKRNKEVMTALEKELYQMEQQSQKDCCISVGCNDSIERR